MADPKTCPLCEAPAYDDEEGFRAGYVSCSSTSCVFYLCSIAMSTWERAPRRPTVEELAEKLAKIPPEMWVEAQDNNDERVAWRAIAEEILK